MALGQQASADARRRFRLWRYSFCVAKFVKGKNWHIRRLTDSGRQLGGVSDTKTLCNKYVAHDLGVDLTETSLEAHACRACLSAYRKYTTGTPKN